MKLKRASQNPILRPTKQIWENKWVYNCAATVFEDKICLIYRAQGDDNISRLGMARLSDEVTVSDRSPTPIFEPDPESEYEYLGVEDPRITKIGNNYYIVYTAASHYPAIVAPKNHARSPHWRVRVSMVRTRDFHSFTRYGVIVDHIDSKDATLFPEKISGNFLLAHRVIPHVRLAITDDIHSYKERGPLFGPREEMWDGFRVGIGAQPLKTPYGWLLFYHGVDEKKVYRLGLALLDIYDPSIVLARSDEPILEPQESYEKEGLVPNVVFTCGVIESSDEYFVYYGAADAVICLATIKKELILRWAKEQTEQAEHHQSF